MLFSIIVEVLLALIIMFPFFTLEDKSTNIKCGLNGFIHRIEITYKSSSGENVNLSKCFEASNLVELIRIRCIGKSECRIKESEWSYPKSESCAELGHGTLEYTCIPMSGGTETKAHIQEFVVFRYTCPPKNVFKVFLKARKITDSRCFGRQTFIEISKKCSGKNSCQLDIATGFKELSICDVDGKLWSLHMICFFEDNASYVYMPSMYSKSLLCTNLNMAMKYDDFNVILKESNTTDEDIRLCPQILNTLNYLKSCLGKNRCSFDDRIIKTSSEECQSVVSNVFHIFPFHVVCSVMKSHTHGIKNKRNLVKNLNLECRDRLAIRIKSIENAYDTLAEEHLNDFYNKCPVVRIFHEALERLCTNRSICSVHGDVISEVTKLCPLTQLLVRYECVGNGQPIAPIQSPYLGLWCFGELEMEIESVELANEFGFHVVTSRDVDCPHFHVIRNAIQSSCNYNHFCHFDEQDITFPIHRACDADGLRLKVSCHHRSYDDSYEYEIKCYGQRSVRGISIDALDKSGHRIHSSKCHFLAYLKQILKKRCRNKDICKVDKQIIAKIQKHCLDLHYTLIRYTCQLIHKNQIQRIHCPNDEVIEVSLKITKSILYHKLCPSIVRVALRLKDRCSGKSRCEILLKEIDFQNDACNMESPTSVTLNCVTRKTFDSEDYDPSDELNRRMIMCEGIRQGKNDIQCTKVTLNLHSGTLEANLGFWNIDSNFHSDLVSDGMIGEVEEKLVIPLLRQHYPKVTLQKQSHLETVENFCRNGKCNYYFVPFPSKPSSATVDLNTLMPTFDEVLSSETETSINDDDLNSNYFEQEVINFKEDQEIPPIMKTDENLIKHSEDHSSQSLLYFTIPLIPNSDDWLVDFPEPHSSNGSDDLKFQETNIKMEKRLGSELTGYLLNSQEKSSPNSIAASKSSCTATKILTSCQCFVGIQRPRCSLTTDPCQRKSCFDTLVKSNQCKANRNSFNCICLLDTSSEFKPVSVGLESWLGVRKTRKKRNPECQCPFGFYGRNCQHRSTQCLNNQCQNGGTCVDLLTRTICICPPGTEGTNCEKSLNLPNCRREPCFYGGRYCKASHNSTHQRFTCRCSSSLEKSCKKLKSSNACSSNPCIDTAQCIPTEGGDSYFCLCPFELRNVGCQRKNSELPIFGSLKVPRMPLRPVHRSETTVQGNDENLAIITAVNKVMDVLNKVADKDMVREHTSNRPVAGELMKPVLKLTKLTTRKVSKLLAATPTRGPVIQVYPVPKPFDQMSAKGPQAQALLQTYNKSYLHHEPWFLPLSASLSSDEMSPQCLLNPCANGGTCFVDHKKGSFMCKCRPGFAGKLCTISDSYEVITSLKGSLRDEEIDSILVKSICIVIAVALAIFYSLLFVLYVSQRACFSTERPKEEHVIIPNDVFSYRCPSPTSPPSSSRVGDLPPTRKKVVEKKKKKNQIKKEVDSKTEAAQSSQKTPIPTLEVKKDYSSLADKNHKSQVQFEVPCSQDESGPKTLPKPVEIPEATPLKWQQSMAIPETLSLKFKEEHKSPICLNITCTCLPQGLPAESFAVPASCTGVISPALVKAEPKESSQFKDRSLIYVGQEYPSRRADVHSYITVHDDSQSKVYESGVPRKPCDADLHSDGKSTISGTGMAIPTRVKVEPCSNGKDKNVTFAQQESLACRPDVRSDIAAQDDSQTKVCECCGLKKSQIASERGWLNEPCVPRKPFDIGVYREWKSAISGTGMVFPALDKVEPCSNGKDKSITFAQQESLSCRPDIRPDVATHDDNQSRVCACSGFKKSQNVSKQSGLCQPCVPRRPCGTGMCNEGKSAVSDVKPPVRECTCTLLERSDNSNIQRTIQLSVSHLSSGQECSTTQQFSGAREFETQRSKHSSFQSFPAQRSTGYPTPCPPLRSMQCPESFSSSIIQKHQCNLPSTNLEMPTQSMSPVMASTPYPCQQIQPEVQRSTQCPDLSQVKLRYIAQPPSCSELSSSIPGKIFDKPPTNFSSYPGEVGFTNRLSGSPTAERSAPCPEIRSQVLQHGFSDRPVGSPPTERSAPCPENGFQVMQRGFSDRPIGSLPVERSAPCPENGSQVMQRGFSDRPVGSPPVERSAPCPKNGFQVMQRGFSDRPVGSPPVERSAPCPENGSQVMQRGFSDRPVGSPPVERSAPYPKNGFQVMQRGFSDRPVGSPPVERSAPCLENGSQVMQRGFSNRPIGSPPAERNAPSPEIRSQLQQLRFSNRSIGSPPTERNATGPENVSQLQKLRFSNRSIGSPPAERNAMCPDINGSPRQSRYYEVNSLPSGVILTRSRSKIASEKEKFEDDKMKKSEVIDALVDIETQTENKMDSKDNQSRLSRKLDKLESENMVERFLSNVPDLKELEINSESSAPTPDVKGLKIDTESSAATSDVPDIAVIYKTEPTPTPKTTPKPTPKPTPKHTPKAKPSPNPNSNSKNVKTSTLSSSTKESKLETKSFKKKPIPKEIPAEYLVPGSGRGTSANSSFFFTKSPKSSKPVLSDEEAESIRHVGRRTIYLKNEQRAGNDPNSPKSQLNSPDSKSFKSPDIKSLKSPDIKSFKSPDIKSLKSTETKSFKSPDIKSLKSTETKSLKSLDKKSSKSKSNSTVSTPPGSDTKSDNKSKNSRSERNIVKYFSNYTPEELMQLLNELASIDSNLVSSVLEGYPESAAAVLGLVSRKTSRVDRSPSDNSSLKSNDDSEIGKLFLKPIVASVTNSSDSYGDLREMNFRIGYDGNQSNNASNDHVQYVDNTLIANEDSIDCKAQKTLEEDDLNNVDSSIVTTYDDPSIGSHFENQCSMVSTESWSSSEDSTCDFQFFSTMRVRRKATLWDKLKAFSGRAESVKPEDELPLIRRGRNS